MAYLLARSAESLFWMARYLERIENLVRLLDITKTFARGNDDQNWLSVVQINADEEEFFNRHDKAELSSVSEFYLLDANNPTSIQSAILAAHQNARSLRPVISIELWAHINVMCHRLRQLTETDICQQQLSRLCRDIRNDCYVHQGIVDVSLSRDETWHFYQLGKMIERADQTTRLLDIKYHILQPRALGIGSALDVIQWNALLRAAAGYQAFRRLHQGRMQPAAVVQFLIFSDIFPRSVQFCMNQCEELLFKLGTRYHLGDLVRIHTKLDGVRATLASYTADKVIDHGMHEFLDWLQGQLAAITGETDHWLLPESVDKRGR